MRGISGSEGKCGSVSDHANTDLHLPQPAVASTHVEVEYTVCDIPVNSHFIRGNLFVVLQI